MSHRIEADTTRLPDYRGSLAADEFSDVLQKVRSRFIDFRSPEGKSVKPDNLEMLVLSVQVREGTGLFYVIRDRNGKSGSVRGWTYDGGKTLELYADDRQNMMVTFPSGIAFEGDAAALSLVHPTVESYEYPDQIKSVPLLTMASCTDANGITAQPSLQSGVRSRLAQTVVFWGFDARDRYGTDRFGGYACITQKDLNVSPATADE